MEQAPRATPQMLVALDMYLGPAPEIVLLGELEDAGTAAALAALRHRYVPNRVLAARAPAAGISGPLDPLFAGKALDGPQPGVFLCENFACQAPVFGRAAAIAAWDAIGKRWTTT
jgi:uncharacterized protein YyaL (SSP411 family)